jgi:hypothetical protein
MGIWMHLVDETHDFADRIHAPRERMQVFRKVPDDFPGHGHGARKLVSR